MSTKIKSTELQSHVKFHQQIQCSVYSLLKLGSFSRTRAEKTKIIRLKKKEEGEDEAETYILSGNVTLLQLLEATCPKASLPLERQHGKEMKTKSSRANSQI